MADDKGVHRLQFGHFKAAVEIGGKLARCYDVSVSKRKKEVTCWIASELGQNFGVRLEKEETPYHCCPDIILDGTKMEFVPLEKTWAGKVTYDSVDTSKTTMRPFVFGKLNVTDNEALLDALLLNNPTEGNLGEIRMTIHRAVHIIREKVRKESWDSEESDSESSDDSEDDDEGDTSDDKENETNSGKKPGPESHAESVPEIRMVHESSTKATTIPHQIKFGEKIIIQNYIPKEAPLRALGRPNVLERVRAEASKPSVEVTKPRKPEVVSCRGVRERIVTFVFMYRPIETLRANGVVPPVFKLRFPGGLFLAAARDSAVPTEVHQSPGPISLLGTIDEDRNSQLPSRTENPPTSGAPHIGEESEIPSVPELAANDGNSALATLTDSTPYPPMRLPTPEEEKPMITPIKTAEEDEINSQIKQLQLQLEEVKKKKRQIEEANNTTSKRVKTENVQHFFPGEMIDLALDA